MVEVIENSALCAVSGGAGVYKVFKEITNVAFCFVVGDLLTRAVTNVNLVHPISVMMITVGQFAILPLVDGWFTARTERLVRARNALESWREIATAAKEKKD